MKGAEQLAAERRRGKRLWSAGPRLRVELAVEDLAGRSFRKAFQLFVEAWADSFVRASPLRIEKST